MGEAKILLRDAADLADLLLEGVANADRQLGNREDPPWVGVGSRVYRLTAVAGRLATVARA